MHEDHIASRRYLAPLTEKQNAPFCVPQGMGAEIPAAAQNGASLRAGRGPERVTERDPIPEPRCNRNADCVLFVNLKVLLAE